MKHVTFKINHTLTRTLLLKEQHGVASYGLALSLENPQDWFTRMEAAHQVLTASSGHDIPQKTFAIAAMGPHASILLADLLAPQQVSDDNVTYDALKNILITHLRSQHLELAERSLFYATAQLDGESAASFFSLSNRLRGTFSITRFLPMKSIMWHDETRSLL